ncbi:hypothetical protein ABMZ32_24085 [Escherichia coli]|uniref:hypothetical protein n=1 Tax=Escherichia coli TaxID=562 RepID=UPI0013E33841|nr:hypothetical protein [Escherichia coli]MBK0819494.1 hypothetical protein [Escherichia coli]MBW8976803.1 hypothetical protein [Escherichia coli]HAI2653740.1 hypothetical protein [Escherichia coli]HAI5827220.1 hypothetical protein [Escherichia coli]HAP2461715.1 hypothetical protein [Escherichia coli]
MSFIFNEETLYFTVFGGDFIMDDLKIVKNTEAWVWYKIAIVKIKKWQLNFFKSTNCINEKYS